MSESEKTLITKSEKPLISKEEFQVLLNRYKSSAGEDKEAVTALQPYKVTNAVIMAAGMSSRFAPLSFEKPKGLLKVKGEILIEREIRQLQEAGISDIIIVVGYMKEEFMYLKDCFNIEIINNDDYYRYNNTSTLMCVADRLDRTYICSSDNYFAENPFEPYVYQSFYAAVYGQGQTDEYCLQTKDDGLITGVTIGGSDSWYMLGHVYFDRQFSRRFLDILTKAYEEPQTKAQLWENLYMRYISELPLYIRRYPDGVIYEFDTLEELRAFDETYKTNAGSEILRSICTELSCQECNITGIEVVESGPEVQSFRFSVKGEQYIYARNASDQRGELLKK